jgi:adenosylcobyric acid synthase
MKRPGEIRAKPIMVQGTSSHVGKSVLTAAVCRILKQGGFKVAPFKAQNMALNAFATKGGGEIGRAQAFQAEAAGCEPTVDMNPVLLKPTADSLTQVIVQGKVYGVMSASEYQGFKKVARRFVLESYTRLAALYDVIVIEGAGSPSEINLREDDIVNMGMAEMVGSPVLIVGDIDRGGVFASIVGTMELLSEVERNRVKGFIINKFRGDIGLLKPGLEFLSKRTGVPVLGVVPYLDRMVLPDEDGVALEGLRPKKTLAGGEIKIVVLKLPRISNFTDFDPLKLEPGVSLDFVVDPGGLEGADLAVIPGSKNTIGDLMWLKKRGFSQALKRFVKGGGMVAGICGGFQLMGVHIKDPFGVESETREAEGLKLIEGSTVLTEEKKTFQVTAELTGIAEREGIRLTGYEIHMGDTVGTGKPFAIIRERNSTHVRVEDGYVSEGGDLWGTYIHGIFDNDRFRGALMNELRRRNGVPAFEGGSEPFAESKERAISTFAEVVRKGLDMEMLNNIIGL